MKIEFRKPRTLALSGLIQAGDVDPLIRAISGLGPDRPIVLSFDEVTGIDAGGIQALRDGARWAHRTGVVLTFLVPPTGVLDSLRGAGFDEEPQILLEVLGE